MIDKGGSADDSANANPTGSVDFSSGPLYDQPSFYYYGDGNILYFRLRINGPPLALTGSGQPYRSATWNILFDTDGDGYKEFVLMLDGTDSGAQPDDIVVIYDDAPSQRFIISQAGIWRQDSAGPSNGVNGVPGNSSDWDIDTDPYVWDFGRTRVVQINRSLAPGHNNSEYFLDIQAPLAAFDATAIGGPKLTGSSFFSLIATSSTSNTDPTQRDVIYNGDFAFGDVRVPMGDFVDSYGNILQQPIVKSITATPCPSPITVKATVLDAIEVDPVTREAIDTLDYVIFEYYYDYNANGMPDDEGSEWINMGSASRTSILGEWQFMWDASLLRSGHYLIRAIAADVDGNITTSTEQPYLTPSSVTASFNNVCSIIANMNNSTKVVSDINGGQTVPGDTLSYTITVKNTGGLDAFNVTLTDTLSSHLKYVPGSAAPVPVSIDPALSWNIGIVPSGETYTYSYKAVIKSSVSSNTEIINKGWIDYDSGLMQNLRRKITSTITISSYPELSITKIVDKSLAAPLEILTYTLYYTNLGSDMAADVVITDYIDHNLEYVPGSTTHNGVSKTDVSDEDEVSFQGNTLFVNIGILNPGESGQVIYQARVR